MYPRRVREISYLVVLYFNGVCGKGESLLAPAQCLSRYSKLQIISRIYRLVSVFDSLIVNNLTLLKLGIEIG